MSLENQAKLLRVVADKQVLRINETTPRDVDVRFVFATNADLKARTARGEFRPDLCERVNRNRIHLPPLRERREDIPLLGHHFVDQGFDGRRRRTRWVSRQAMGRLMDCGWPGNVRQLRNCISEALSELSDRDVMFSWDLRLDEEGPPGAPPSPPDQASRRRPRPIAEVEEEKIREALEYTGGNKARAARLLGWARNTLNSKVRKYGIETPARDAPPAAGN